MQNCRSIGCIFLAAFGGASVLWGATCGELSHLTIPAATLTAEEVSAGSFSPVGGANATQVPAFCRVVGVAKPAAESLIRFEVWIPSVAWNGKLQGVGNSGWSGAIPYAAMLTALRRGYAAAGTDAGHAGDDLKFGLSPDKVADWAWRAEHLTAEAAKAIVRAREGRLPVHSYFTGCSTGGAQGLTEAQRFPGDYDGILASDPGNERIDRVASYLWSWSAAHETTDSAIPPAKLAWMTENAVEQCDRMDGVRDGVIEDPRKCRFDPATLACQGADDGKCLTAAQVRAAKKIYAGPVNPRTGARIFPGEPPGSENFGRGANAGWSSYIMQPAEAMRLDFWRYFVFNDPQWDWRTFDWDRDLEYAHEKMASIEATATQLDGFRQAGGRIVMYLGWDDPIHLSESALDYYSAVVGQMGGQEKTGEFFRTFLVPGLGHCSEGPGTTSIDALPALEAWTERGVAPAKIPASRIVNGAMVRTRPLCPYPAAARWSGTGSTDDAANFACIRSKN